MAYSDKVLKHYERPSNVGSLDSGNNSVGTGLVGAPECGDVMKLQLKINDNGIIEDAKFKTFGCGSAIASSSLVEIMILFFCNPSSINFFNVESGTPTKFFIPFFIF